MFIDDRIDPCFECRDFTTTDLNFVCQKLIDTYIIQRFDLKTAQSVKQNHSFNFLKMWQQMPRSCERVFSPYKLINIGSIDVGDGKRCVL